MSTMTNSPTSPWAMTVPQPGQGEYTPCPAGNHPGRIVGLYDVGHQPEVRQNKKTGMDESVSVRKLVVVFELTKKTAGGAPHYMGQKFTWSMNDSSNFYKFVQSVTGQRFAPGASFDPTSLLGVPVMVNVTNTTPNDKGQFYANVGAVTQYPEGFPPPTTTTEPRAWSILEGKPAPTDSWLPRVYGKTVADLAGESREVKGGPAPASTPTQGPAPATVIRNSLDEYTAAVAVLIQKYGMSPGYTVDDLEALASLKAMPAEDKAALMNEAVPF